jgi:hypothetical protein
MSFDGSFNHERLWETAPEVALDDLPSYSPWSARMLGLQDWKRPERTLEDVEREFERETYAPRYEYIRGHPEAPDHEALEAGMHPEGRGFVCVRKNQFRRLPVSEAHRLEAGLVAERLSAELPASALVELGAGSGRMSLNLARDGRVKGTPVMALEKMESGRRIIQAMAERKGLSILTGTCDLTAPDITPRPIPEQAVLFTNSVWYLLPAPARQVVEGLKRFKPKAVFHFEPFACFHDERTLYGQLCSAYLRINKYNAKNGEELRRLHGESIEIIRQEYAVFGNNPYLPHSLIAWKPGWTS